MKPDSTGMPASPPPVRAAFAALGAFDGFTACWIAWGLFTPGDFFANGSPLAWLTLAAAACAGAWLGFRGRSKVGRAAFIVAALIFGAFWVAVPNGWWAARPPRPRATSHDPSPAR